MLLLVFPTKSVAQYDFTTESYAAYQDVLKLKTDSENVTRFLQRASPDSNAIDVLVLNYIDVIQLLSQDQSALYNKLSSQEPKRLSYLFAINKRSAASPYSRFIEAGVKLQWAVVKLKYEDNVSAFWGFRKGYQLLEKNEKEYPDFIPHKQLLGVMQVMLGKVPSRYQWILKLMGMSGEEEKGLENLEKVIASDSVFRKETALYRSFLDVFILENGEEAFQQFKSFYEEDSTDLLSLYALSFTGLKKEKNTEVIALLNDPTLEPSFLKYPIFYHLKTHAYLQSGDYTTCIKSGHKFLNHFQGENYRKDTHFRIALAHWFLGNEDSLHHHLEKIKEKGSEKISLDRYAQSFADQDKLPHKLLTKARFYSDGGYYDKALTSISLIEEKLEGLEEQEYYYRTARIYHHLEEWGKAKEAYETVVRISNKKTDSYYPPNAALQLGILYKTELQDVEVANMYLKIVLEYYGDYPYKSEIRDKAKSMMGN